MTEQRPPPSGAHGGGTLCAFHSLLPSTRMLRNAKPAGLHLNALDRAGTIVAQRSVSRNRHPHSDVPHERASAVRHEAGPGSVTRANQRSANAISGRNNPDRWQAPPAPKTIV